MRRVHPTVVVAFVALLLWTAPATAAVAIIAQWSECTTNSNQFTTTSKTTTGADYEIVAQYEYNDRGSASALTSALNTLTAKTAYGTGGVKLGTVRIYINESPTTGSESFTTSSTGAAYYCVFALALSGTAGVGAFDGQTGTDGVTTTTQTAGSITPTAANDIFIAFVTDSVAQGGTHTPDTGYTALTNTFDFVSATHVAGAASYKIKASDSSAENPQYSGLNAGGFSPDSAMTLVAIKAAGGGGATSHPCSTLHLLGVGCEVHP